MNVIIIGGGQVGSYIASLLLFNKYSVKIIDNREHIIEKLKRELPVETVVFGNGTDPDILEAAGINKADVLVAVTGADETNLVASTLAKFEFGVPRVVGRVNNPKNAWLFNLQMGVDVSLNQADILGHMVIEEMDLRNIFTLLKLSMGTYSIIRTVVEEESPAIGKAVRDLEFPMESRLILLSRGKEVILPIGDTIIERGDIILALANEVSQVKINEMFGASI
ncbi:MAG: TrkA family potassium uptake protein [Clostridiaceae bacterium]